MSVKLFVHSQEQVEVPSPPPAYETVVEGTSIQKDCHTLQETVTQPCLTCNDGERCDSDLPSYEAAVMLRDTKL
ncbi:unnamed protein product [Arctia plantaginis]|uniref:Uncharacterized protein n=1 Tax=Arctia plantaginis TaxID=874455 RepID=A0A8S1A2C2_ARCPL|nr:unnamed protein product [Arctia plantaginis]